MVGYKKMGDSGLLMTEIAFGSALTIGTEHDDQTFADEMVSAAWGQGIRTFDLADSYGAGRAELLVGRALSAYPRDEYVVVTKTFHPMGNSPYHRGLGRKHVMASIDASLERLGTDFVDVYFAHRPDPDVPIEEVCMTFNRIIDSGKALYWGTSEWPADALNECHEVCDRIGLEKPIVEQPIYSFAVRKIEQNGVMDFCRSHGVGLMGYSPLCQGLLTGKYRNGVPDGSRISKAGLIAYNKTAAFAEQYGNRIEGFLRVCDAYGLKPSSTALMWCIRAGIVPVLGASSPDQLDDTLSEIGKELPGSAWRDLEAI